MREQLYLFYKTRSYTDYRHSRATKPMSEYNTVMLHVAYVALVIILPGP